MRKFLFFLFCFCLGCTAAPTTPTHTAVPRATPLPPTPTLAPAVIRSTVTQTAVLSTPPATAAVTAVPSPTPSPTPIPFPVYQGEPLDPTLIGVQIHLRDEDQAWLFDHLDALNVGWVKVQVSWKLYEPQPGAYHVERFAELDRFIERANGSGIQVMLGVSKAPEWSRPTTEMDGPPGDFALFQTFTAYLAQRYVGQVAAYELWNEPNLQREWNGRSLSGGDLVELMRFGAVGVRQHDPGAVLISGAPATTGINDGVTAIDDRVYLRQMLKAGVGDFVDAIGAHPYGAANPPDSTVANPSPLVQGYDNHPSFFFLDTLNDYEVLLVEYGVTLPIWVTEFGWGTFENMSDTVPAGADFMQQVSEWEQAEYIARAFELNQQRDRPTPMILWNLNFGPLLGTDFSESGYSILGPDGQLRPAYLTLQDALTR